MDEFKEAPDEATGNKKKVVAGAAGIVALFAGLKIWRKLKKRKRSKEEELQDDK